jgi:hypothetical protein
MINNAKQDSPQVSFAKTKAPCTDVKLGKLMADYLANALPVAQMKKVQHHLGSCTSCAVFEANMTNLKAALRTLPRRGLLNQFIRKKLHRRHQS